MMLDNLAQALSAHFWALMALAAMAFAAIDLVNRGATPATTLARQWLLHGALYGLGLVLVLNLPISMLAGAAASFRLGIGLRAWADFGFAGDFALWVFFYTLTQYLFHLSLHRVRFLWSLHRVHHLDEIVDSSTTLRHHPGESLVALLVFSTLAFILAPPMAAIVLWSCLEFLTDFWTHGRTPLPDGLARKVEAVLFTPRLHRVHHSAFEPQTNSNYGNVFTAWDRLFGTFRRELPERLGLDDAEASGDASRDFDKLLLDPVMYLRRRRENKA
ncbi:MAG: sterol desaturase family protein [Alphaproteobacteria bacterium]|nr:sterol desaturase family protein [Alphaproteobacteria bacterium]